MTCVLSVTSIHTFSTDNVEIDRECCETICFDRLSAQNEHLSPTMCCKCLNKYQTDDKNGRSIFYRSEISNERLQAVEYQNYKKTCFEDWRNNFFQRNRKNKTPVTSSDQTHSKHVVEDCNKTGPETTSLNASPKHGIKRKFELTTSEEEYVSPKRVSPYYNTQKERKDDRKKILKMSIKKLKDLDDPETFLRRTVLVNNTMKRLQVDLQEEHEQTKGFKSLRRYGVPGNMCKSDLYFI
ncbi:uncharacterized protein LOC132748816 [Ruditapes philippinarum]|uniref:uncharacterized protein LOC132748816 n=1 Tax=Ruditapes philippinarum TaxID=129788 RepID=UPI00295B3A55|nr:uncharacterized protein LOC132748816 [Ruditapes philippinarum]